jgi:hypothetical protein
MRYLTTGLLLAGLLALAAAASPTRAADPKDDPFIGTDPLSGWEGLTKYWSWKDGALVGSYKEGELTHNTFLWSKKKFTDFELSFKIRLKDGDGNSGVQIRSEILDKDQFTAKGPQCDIGQQYWGSLYGENFGGMMKASDAKLIEKILKKDDFNDYYIKCVGKHVTIKLNGETTVDDDFDKLPADGRIGFQLHTGFKGMEVTFKDFKFTDLSKK